MFIDRPPRHHRAPTAANLLETVTEENYFFKPLRISRTADHQPHRKRRSVNRLDIQPEVRRNEVLSFLRGNLQSVTREFRDRELNEQSRKSAVVVSYLTDEDTERVLRASSELPRGGEIAQLDPREATYIPGALKDLSISRSSFKWGIPVPGDEKPRRLRMARRARQLHDRASATAPIR